MQHIYICMIEGSLNRNFRQYGELKSSRRVVKSVDRRCNSQKVRRKEDTSAPNVREVAKCCVFSMIRVSGQSKSRPVKAAGAESGGQRIKQKLHAAVAKSTFGSKNVKKLRVRDHFWKFRCPKIARRCGEKHIRK